MRPTLRASLLVTSLALSSTAFAIIDGLEFGRAVDEQRFRSVAGQLRCLVCQNESLLGSQAELANDLRREVYSMMTTGRSDKEIFDFMVARYGEFVLYEPPFKPTTYVLWLAPLAVLAFAATAVLRTVRRRRQDQPPGLAAGDVARARALLDAENDAPPHA